MWRASEVAGMGEALCAPSLRESSPGLGIVSVDSPDGVEIYQ